MLRVEGLEKAYDGRPVLRGVDFRADAGEIVALLARNGGGKTTVLSIVAGLRSADRGTVAVDGIDAIRARGRLRNRIGYAPQETGVYPALSVEENLRYFGALAGLRGSALRRSVGEAAERMGLVPLLRRKAQALSGGERRRLHTAAALVHRPPLVLLDEPTVGADVEARRAILDVVTSLAKQGSAVVYTSHYLPEIEALAASVAILHDGRVIARGTLDELVAAHGGSAVDLTFSDVAPKIESPRARRVDERTLRIEAAEPGRALADALRRIGPAADDLVHAQIVRPSLESVFLCLTGEHFDHDRRFEGTVG